ncbi:tRNA (adenosine(37)-N6)-threonylcarbamoyltransferase complex dimerization subunit type 1 TsaB [Candidatus Phycosocius spiralis]|uniref:tRNA (Adenosine(37)-N6)-threonylcarbamoyltransferase complex dimerization subunit type 1 TsaB n=1 Tax=Candidatus Phycosocius spiralis TaxID=2815099 RepID=A0ABQ4PVL3_9PROT|nr:tRNA (adenosine(37)-N6)-threonylcarbamoyltransferase complex dimerization subunit type 1 TsaB [Candidatus Phycosocius spiralis]GIU67017.1 tRNA (adenosine(37)-N6)-threonylcarbamoyltransferase complex dimerization subunit type 1 TsaB [Candidatus Phycosocius spiralis]
MLILAIDTALNACSVALVADGATRISMVEPMAKGQAERLPYMVDEAMTQAGYDMADLDRIAVTRGPGTFTGVRIGLAFGRGLAIALGKPCVGLSTLEILAKRVDQPKVVAAIEVAGSLFIGAWADGRCELPPIRYGPDTMLTALDESWTITGPGASGLLPLMPKSAIEDQDLCDPVVLARLASAAAPQDYPPLPLYLRGHDTKVPSGLIARGLD